MNSFKLLDPTQAQTNNHFEDSHQRRAEHDHYAEGLSKEVLDLIHMGAVNEGEEFEDLTADDLREAIGYQTFYMQRNFDHAHNYLSSVGQHYQQIMAEFDQEDMYEHDRKLNKDLF